MKFFFFIHLTVLLVGMFLLSLAVLGSLLYLLKYRELKSKKFGTLLEKFPSLEALDIFSVRMLVWGVVFLTFGNFSGIVIAHLKGSPDWMNSPKFLMAMAAWVWYLSLLFLRKRLGWRGAKFFILVCVGFFILAAVFLGSI